MSVVARSVSDERQREMASRVAELMREDDVEGCARWWEGLPEAEADVVLAWSAGNEFLRRARAAKTGGGE